MDVKRLRALDLRGCGQVGDAALEHLKEMKSLDSLKLGGYAITDSGMAALADMPGLKSLAIEDAMIGNAGLPVPKILSEAASSGRPARFFDQPGIGIGKFFVAG